MADATVSAGRGVIYIAAAKLYFMAAGYAIYFTLPRFLGSPVLWGEYLLVVGLVSVINNVVVTGTIQGVSKFTAQDDALANGVKAAALKVQLLLGGGITAAYILAAPHVAAWERDPALTPLYRLSAGIMLCYSFYAVFVGSLNGQRHFGRQATLDVSFATLRAGAILGLAALGFGVFGAVGGFVGAAALILVASAFWVGLPRRGAPPFPVRRLASFMVRLFLYTLTLNLIMRVDLFLLKRLAGALSGEVEAGAQSLVASAHAGYYGTAQSLAFVPYQAILAVAFVIFPLISRSTFEKDLDSTRAYIRQTLRFSLVFVAGVAVVFIANPAAVVNVPYAAEYRVAGPALRILAGGMVCFSLFTIINTILNSAGHTYDAIASGLITLLADYAANALLIPRAGSPLAALEVAAWCSAGAMALGALVSGLLLYRRYRASFPPLSLVRVLLAMALVVVVGRLIPEVGKLVTLAECVGLFVLYFAVLVATREFGGDDLGKLKRIFSRKRS